MPIVQALFNVSFDNDQLIVNDSTSYAAMNLYFTDFSAWNANNRFRFDSFTGFFVKFPSGEIKVYATNKFLTLMGMAGEIIDSPSHLFTKFSINGSEIGVYTICIVNIPTGIPQSTAYDYDPGDRVYYGNFGTQTGTLYNLVSGGVDQMFDPNSTNWEKITADQIMEVVNIALGGTFFFDNYIFGAQSFNLDYIKQNFVAVLKRIACYILKEPTVKDLCKSQDYESYIMMKSIIPQLELLDTSVDMLEIRNMINYINQYCQKEI